jgi:hypothetical protein
MDPRRHRGTGKGAVSDEHENSRKPWSVPYFSTVSLVPPIFTIASDVPFWEGHSRRW